MKMEARVQPGVVGEGSEGTTGIRTCIPALQSAKVKGGKAF